MASLDPSSSELPNESLSSLSLLPLILNDFDLPFDNALVSGTEVKGGPRSIGVSEDFLNNRESSSVSPKELSESDSKMSDFINGSELVDTVFDLLSFVGGGFVVPLVVSLLLEGAGPKRSSRSEPLFLELAPTRRVYDRIYQDSEMALVTVLHV